MGLEPETRRKCQLFLIMAADQGIPCRITFTVRTQEEQDALYAQGRQARKMVNALRLKAGMSMLPSLGPNRVVTWVRHSKHQDGIAFDVVPMKRLDSLLPNWNSPMWKKLGAIGEHLGLTWGGNWTKPDRPHFEWNGGTT